MTHIDETACTACGKCARICPQGFSMEENRAVVTDPRAPCVPEAVTQCPTGAIHFHEEDSPPASEPRSRQPEFSGGSGPGRGMGGGRGLGPGRGKGGGMGRGRGGGRGRRG